MQPIIDKIVLCDAAENNLKNINVEIPHNQITVVTGVSGSGKSSLVFDILFREGERRYFEAFPSFSRRMFGKLQRPNIGSITGLRPVIAVGQQTVVRNPRSTVGTLSGLYDLLRLFFARCGTTNIDISPLKQQRRLFSFNSDYGACENCKGLGVEDHIDPELLISDSKKTIRQGAFVMTTPSGYIVYSQVTMDVLNSVCNAHGFDVDTPWELLSQENKNIVLFGSKKLKVPFGKHTLESRMKWSGITAKPREEDFYPGIITTMDGILKRDRNANILRFSRSISCSACSGKRLRKEALSVKFENRDIADFTDFDITSLDSFCHSKLNSKDKVVVSIFNQILKLTSLLNELGLGYLKLNRSSVFLSAGESQRIRLATQAVSGLRGLLYLFDEPSAGLHPADCANLMSVLRKLCNQGNSVVIVEHDLHIVSAADFIIDIGPGAGKNGGEISNIGPVSELLKSGSPYLSKFSLNNPVETQSNSQDFEKCSISNVNINNLKNVSAEFCLGGINIVSGVSGAGKKSLIHDALASAVSRSLDAKESIFDFHSEREIRRLVKIDQSPIGKTPRSNLATYTKCFDRIRMLFSSLEQSKKNGWKANHFSFNVKGGRCETCMGAGVKHIGMHFMGDVSVLCPDCGGKRFSDETLKILWNGKNIHDVLEMEVDEAYNFFEKESKIEPYLRMLQTLGLGYLTLGQPATTLSGGEAQRIRLAAELSLPQKKHTLFILEEPSVGLHYSDVVLLLKALNELRKNGDTVVVISNHFLLLKSSDRIIDIGPGSGAFGGEILFSGKYSDFKLAQNSVTADFCRKQESGVFLQTKKREFKIENPDITLKGVKTNNLKNIDVSIPFEKLTVITGVSGSGKSSLAFDTLLAEGRNRYLENFSAWIRSQVGLLPRADFLHAFGMMPAIGIGQWNDKAGPRSTVATSSEIYDFLRLLFARASTHISTGETCTHFSSDFSFNHENGACQKCSGLGFIRTADPEKLISHPEKSILDGAMSGHKTSKFYGDSNGQYVATLKTVAKKNSLDFSKPWSQLSDNEKDVIMFGCGVQKFDVHWNFSRKGRTGTHDFETVWQGFVYLVDDEYARKHADRRGEAIEQLLKDETCPACGGARLKSEMLKYYFEEKNIIDFSAMTATQLLHFIENYLSNPNCNPVAKSLLISVKERLISICSLGISYLTFNRNVDSLSGGERARLRLATLLGAKLSGMLVVLDEPSAGLHSRDVLLLIENIKRLISQRNTVVVVEHNQQIIDNSDFVIELGPAAGENGGNIIYSGKPKSADFKSENIVFDNDKLNSQTEEEIIFEDCFAHNLKGFTFNLNCGNITAITGVSGAGKSTLAFDVVAKSLSQKKAVGCKSLQMNGVEIELFLMRSFSSKIGGGSLVATNLEFFDKIRTIFAALPESKERNLKKSHFALQNRDGRCQTCNGTGELRTSMDFLSDVYSVCPECNGKRYNKTVLAIKYKGLSIADILELSIAHLFEIFEIKEFSYIVKTMTLAGLSYLKLGQKLSTLSGGESQRLQLAKALIKAEKISAKQTSKRCFVFDEPTRGLHPKDVEEFLELFINLKKSGDTILVTTHNPQLINIADFTMELGPEGGPDGGFLLG